MLPDQFRQFSFLVREYRKANLFELILITQEIIE
ncbi:MAG: hypothetical protein XD92_0027 [Proteiniphilum acetatigenes]|jgi:hypothetical protein|uniref:Uncharacterized protein n=1 Tax=Proteiniphilum acetatigenes TaxID=294710 RepID=A0A124FXQ7_9BACT|nr:MAG: hypothetical protein XD92_0027 [Proteiniphilum acetatigenes]